MLTPQSQYATWSRDRVESWNREDWRLFAATLLFRRLSDYQDGKSSFGWQRESADMACVLEALLTAEDSQNEEVGYRLRKRLAVLLSGKFPSIEQDIKTLYKQRSAFVHGSFFAQIVKDRKQQKTDLPVPDFIFLEAQRDRVRFALIACLRLAQLLREKPDRYKGKSKVMDVLEDAVIDVELRESVLDDLEPIFASLPPSPYQLVEK